MWLLSSGFTWGIHRFKLFAATLRSSSLNNSERSGCMLAVIVFSAILLNQNNPLYMQHEQRETDSGAYTMPPHNRTDYRLDVIAFHCIPCNLLLDRPECFPCHHRLDWPNCTPSALLARWPESFPSRLDDPMASRPTTGSMARILSVRARWPDCFPYALPTRWPDCTLSALLARWPDFFPSRLDGPIASRPHYRLAGPISTLLARWPNCFPCTHRNYRLDGPNTFRLDGPAPSALPARWTAYFPGTGSMLP